MTIPLPHPIDIEIYIYIKLKIQYILRIKIVIFQAKATWAYSQGQRLNKLSFVTQAGR